MALDAHWYWLAFACLLIVLQLLAGDVFFITLSIAAAIMGGIVYFFPDSLSMAMQLLSFAVLAGVSVIAAKMAFSKLMTESNEAPYLNQPGARYMGRSITLENGIANGLGEVRLDGSYWTLRGPDCPPGTRVKIIGVDGAALKIEIQG